MIDEDDRRPEDEVKADFEQMKGEAKRFSADELKDGAWFTKFLYTILNNYAKKVNAAYFKDKYPDLPADAVAERRISLAQRYAALEGGLSAAAYSAAVAATVGSAGGSSPLTIPAGVAAFATDVLYTTRLQLQLAYDLSVLYEAPIDMEDPEDLYDLFKVAFGVKAGEVFRGGVAKLAPEAARVGVKVLLKGSTLQWAKALPVIGKYLLQRNVIKFAIPFASIPISAGFNHYATGAIGRTARQVYRDKAAAREASGRLGAALDDDALLLLKLVFVAANVDGTIEAEEAWLLHAFTKTIAQHDDGSVLDEFRELVNIDRAQVLDEVGSRPAEAKRLLYEAAALTVAADHELHRRELGFMRELAERCAVSFDEKELQRLAKTL
ncbi:MAG: hypothetical protein JNM72_06910 [Deltaproteobacteria bacterium]|nr:hypothetical protein [Deltaproteobacteria bacterium]